ncbi:MAG: hypothetical protein M0002_07200 [Rhodospirillales bacterium]|nr:hypothetical protein [Rhodospirillales bacterium]
MADAAPLRMLGETREGRTVILTLDQPARRNALSLTMRASPVAAFERIEADRSLAAVVITGAALEAALSRARLLAVEAPLSLALTRAFLAAGPDAALERERDPQTMLFRSADRAEGKAAFLAKRTPRFVGD